MKNVAKLAVLGVFGLVLLGLLMNGAASGRSGSTARAQAVATPTPAAANIVPNANKIANSNSATNAAAAAANAAPAGNKTMRKEFTLGQDSLSEYGEVAFNHDTHAFKPYSPDGKSVVGCVECHHTDQPKSALKPPLLTSERNVALTFETWKASSQKVNECRACHFQKDNLPDGKEMPTATYTEGGKSVVKDLDNELAYHINCNTCHDAAAALRPEVKKKPGFATGKDCTICHKSN
jgi:Zn ribbon nucleic-acid-binding protein